MVRLIPTPPVVELPGEHQSLKYVRTFGRSSRYPSPCFAMEVRLGSSSGSELL